MEYRMEELFPVFERLVTGYTHKENGSIPYEKAEELMEAIVYTMKKAEASENYALMNGKDMSADMMYKLGAGYLKDKTEKALKLYNELMLTFSSYGSRCLYDTVVKGMPAFFTYYSVSYKPQDTILTLDYPVLSVCAEHSGIEKIYDYLSCICLEQKFFKRFPDRYIRNVLRAYSRDYEALFENLCEILLTHLSFHLLTGHELMKPLFREVIFELEKVIRMESAQSLMEQLLKALRALVRDYYEDDEMLYCYLSAAVKSIAGRMKLAADHGNLLNVYR